MAITILRIFSVSARRSLFGWALGALLLAGCAPADRFEGGVPEVALAPAEFPGEPGTRDAAGELADPGAIAKVDSRSISEQELPLPGSPSQLRPQLIKRAELSLQVEDTPAAIQAIAQLIAQEQGDILNLNEFRVSGEQRSATLTLRVPQQRLDPSLEALSALGEVTNRNISAEDVSGQIVDVDARLRNLRKQEEMTLKIMERSGEVKDVLAVSQELANVRQSIEQLDAQLQQLRSQVAYSTINLNLTEPARFSAPNRTRFDQELSNTWQGATDSLLGFSRGLIRLGLVLLVWSPYLAVLALLIWGAGRSLHHRRDRPVAASPDLATIPESNTPPAR